MDRIVFGVLIFLIVSCGGNTKKSNSNTSADEKPKTVEQPTALTKAQSYFMNLNELDFEQSILDSLEKPYTIIDYFLLAPTRILGSVENKIKILNTEQRKVESTMGGCVSNIDVLDRRSGFLSFACDGDGGGESFEITFWKESGQPDLVGINKTTWGMCCDESEMIFLHFVDGQWRNVTPKVLPEITYKLFMKPDLTDPNENTATNYLATLPQKGKDIIIRPMNDLGEVLAEYPELLNAIDQNRAITLYYKSGKFTF